MKISIITVCFNASNHIEQTILSVIGQTYKNIEYIIIDGGSNDGTLDLIARYKKHISYYISEPDNGIYDAMNKGVIAATGQWIGFINAGDKYATPTVIEKVVDKLDENSFDVLYGDVILRYTFGRFIARPLPLVNFNECFPFSHPSSFIKCNVLKQKLFDKTYRIVADYHLFYSIYTQGGRFEYLPVTIAEFEAEDGISSQNILSTYIEVSTINGSIQKFTWKYKYLKLYLKNIFRHIIAKTFPKYYHIIMKRSVESKPYIIPIDGQ